MVVAIILLVAAVEKAVGDATVLAGAVVWLLDARMCGLIGTVRKTLTKVWT
jgi:hypothetical protein